MVISSDMTDKVHVNAHFSLRHRKAEVSYPCHRSFPVSPGGLISSPHASLPNRKKRCIFSTSPPSRDLQAPHLISINLNLQIIQSLPPILHRDGFQLARPPSGEVRALDPRPITAQTPSTGDRYHRRQANASCRERVLHRPIRAIKPTRPLGARSQRYHACIEGWNHVSLLVRDRRHFADQLWDLPSHRSACLHRRLQDHKVSR